MDELTEADFELRYRQADFDRCAGAMELYAAYRDGVGGIAYNGERIPDWVDIKFRAKWGWICAWDEAWRLVLDSEKLPDILG